MEFHESLHRTDSENTSSDVDDEGAFHSAVSVPNDSDAVQDSAAPSIAGSEYDDPQLVFECPPKDFGRTESEQKSGKYYTRTTKGTLQFMSTCGAKIFCGEMVKSESMAVLFHYLSTFSLIADDVKKARKKMLFDEHGTPCEFKLPNGKKGKLTVACYSEHRFVLSSTCGTLSLFYRAATFHAMPKADPLPGMDNHGEDADFIFFYDFACGALASLKARHRRLQEQRRPVPAEVKSWAGKSEWLVDRFHFKSHVGKLSHDFVCWRRHCF